MQFRTSGLITIISILSVSSGPGSNTLLLNDELLAGEYLISSSGNTQLNMQKSDGNLVLYEQISPPRALWSSGTTGHPNSRVYMQDDGNLVILNGSNAIWSSHTDGHHVVNATLQDECRLILYSTTGSIIWSTNTTCTTTPTPAPPPTPVPPPTPAPPPTPVDPSTIKHKVLMGYQGWFGCAHDSVPGYNWWHWSRQNAETPGAGNVQFDVFPALNEYPKESLYETNLKWHNGSKVALYSNAAEGVVDLHFRWMHEYNLDGVLVQRFLSDVQSDPGLKQKNIILNHVDNAATKYQRTYAVMWDISGAPKEKWAQWIQQDWARYVSNFTKHPAYLHENGKPVVCIFGLGLNNHKPMPTASDAIALISWIKNRAYVIGSGPFYWRTGDHDAESGYDTVHATFDAIMPWAVGRYNSATNFDVLFKRQVVDDAKLCSSRKQDYAPISFPGYSFHNTDSGQRLNQIPRNGGAFMQAQIDKYLSLDGASFYYIAMFDEVNEGTAIYKAASRKEDCPTNADFVYMSIDGKEIPSDYYLQLTRHFTANAHTHGNKSI